MVKTAMPNLGAGPKLSVSRLKKFFYSSKTAPYLFVSPFILSFLIFFLYPSISTIIMSFQEVLGFSATRFIGFNNYNRLLNEHFFNALQTNTTFTLSTLTILIPLPLLFAVLLNSKLMKGKNFFRAVIFVPALTSVIVAGVAFRLMFGELDTAFVNSIFLKIGLPAQKWTLNYATGMLVMVILAAWRYAGINMIYYLSGLQNIPEELYESADIDGANTFTKLRMITLPLLKPIIIYTLTIGIFDGYRMFGESYVYWNEGMPGDIGLTIVRYIYQQAFQRNDMGLGSAIGITLLVIVLVINLIQLKCFGLFKKDGES